MGQSFGPRVVLMGQQTDLEIYLHISGEGVHRMALTSQVEFNICCVDDL